ncbi:MAG: hypothetical protein JKY56_00750, partial [Kofleriaceae bacterium]|nr:hypothetical protein [Kofleriaceae bacterium]
MIIPKVTALITSIDELDLVAVCTAIAIFVVPTFFHIASDLACRSGRNFSIIPNKLRHFIINLVRLGLIAGAGVLSREIGDDTIHLSIWLGLAVLLFLVAAILGATDRRLTINATTGIVKWRKISLPWWPAKTTFIDQVSLMSFSSSEKHMSVLGVGKLSQFWTTSYNGSVSTTGHSTERMLTWVAQKVNDYIEAFRRHDTDEAKGKRT